MPVVMEISFYYHYSGKSLMRLQSRDCTFVQKAGFSLQFHCHLTVKVWSVEVHAVPNLKAIISSNLEPRGQGHGRTFRGCHPLLKNTILKILFSEISDFFF